MSRCSNWALATVWLAAGLAGCAADKPKPAELKPLTAEIAGRQVWHQSLNAVSFPLSVAVKADRFHVAGDDGTVLALEAATGKPLWSANVGAKIAAGVGSDGRFVSLVTRNNDLVTLEGGNERWRAKLDAQVVTAPLVAGERVFVVGVDRVVHAFDALDGRKLWTMKRPGDALLLKQAGVLTAWKDTLLVGQGARLLGIDPLKGTVRWDVAVTSPRGTNEVERLADLIGPASRVGNSYCVRAFQNAVGCVDADRAALKWSQNGGGVQAVGGDADFLVGADASDRITVRKRAAGEIAWTSEMLLNRSLSAPAVVGPTVVFGDFEGQVHFLARDTGKPVLRLPTDGSAVVGAPALSGITMLVVTAKGGLFAFRPE
ncbi:MAG: PQQ-binding-like beta-propeller repeat protein [Vitreoscilla sp.]|nr:PQQ-binding-like beta-propeller repeat protein [Burkholderiales bacterium]MBP6336036.1 PQQ-binding-like beta-propeller repeat protein [Vitreoscilla sp.]MBP6673704.1 PQQ-binding-like beta-propeller repeat protein [Vitreoscilla sp.]